MERQTDADFVERLGGQTTFRPLKAAIVFESFDLSFEGCSRTLKIPVHHNVDGSLLRGLGSAGNAKGGSSKWQQLQKTCLRRL